MGQSTQPSGAGRTIRTVLVALLVLVLVNEALQYTVVWGRILLATRDARAAISSSVRTAPSDREISARAVQAACEQYGVTLTGYGHDFEQATSGPRVDARLELAAPVRYALLTGIAGATLEGQSPQRWRSHTPTLTFTYTQQFLAYE